jgi:hypothetical protein
MIGHGYMYTGFQPQITYTTPNLAAAGVRRHFQPSRFAGDETKTPGFQAKIDYDWKGSMPGKVWGGLVTQSTSCSVDPCTTKSFTGTGYEIGAKAGFGNLRQSPTASQAGSVYQPSVHSSWRQQWQRKNHLGYFRKALIIWQPRGSITVRSGQNGFVLSGASPMNRSRTRPITLVSIMR